MDSIEQRWLAYNARAGGEKVTGDRLIVQLNSIVGNSTECTCNFYKNNPTKQYKVAVIGTTGAGKSALIGSLLGYGLGLDGRPDPKLCYNNAREEGFEESEAAAIGKPVLGTDGAQTLGTQIHARNDSKGQLAFVDCGGFLDTRGVVYDICNAAAFKCIESLYAIVVVISSSMVLDNHSTVFIQLVAKLRKCSANLQRLGNPSSS